MARKYQVWYNKNKITDAVTTWFVTDITEEESARSRKIFEQSSRDDKIRYLHQEHIRPRVATFPVSELYDSDTQERRASMLAEYLNKIEDARRHAESQTALVDLLTAQAPTNP